MYINEQCPHLIMQRDRNGEIAIWYCCLLEQLDDKEGNCGRHECPLGVTKDTVFSQ